MLKADYTPQFKRDYKRLVKRHVDMAPLHNVMQLVVENSLESIAELKRRHNMHHLKGEWSGSNECHVANAEDWLLIWMTDPDVAVFQRTGTHDELFA